MIKKIKLKFGRTSDSTPEEIITTPITVFVGPNNSGKSKTLSEIHNWLINIFEKMGEDPESEDYLKPSDNDVWSFVGEIKKWFIDPNRKGIPS
jgi:predicted ATPase